MMSSMDARSRILVVDDDPRIAASVRRALVYDGHEVAVAANHVWIPGAPQPFGDLDDAWLRAQLGLPAA